MDVIIDPSEWRHNTNKKGPVLKKRAVDLVMAYDEGLRKAGLSVGFQQIYVRVAKELGVHHQTVRGWCISAGVVAYKPRDRHKVVVEPEV